MVSTVNGAGEPKLFTRFRPAVVFIDEAGMIVESDALIFMTHYGPAPVVMVGDQKQLKPTVLTVNSGSQQFIGHLLMLMFSCMLCLGHSSVMLTE